MAIDSVGAAACAGVNPALNVTAPNVPIPSANPINSFFIDALPSTTLNRAREYKQTDEASFGFIQARPASVRLQRKARRIQGLHAHPHHQERLPGERALD
jgi:hypothetical protein